MFILPVEKATLYVILYTHLVHLSFPFFLDTWNFSHVIGQSGSTEDKENTPIEQSSQYYRSYLVTLLPQKCLHVYLDNNDSWLLLLLL